MFMNKLGSIVQMKVFTGRDIIIMVAILVISDEILADLLRCHI
jgi:hypothetical protein